jgi:ribosome biogenesis GTPase
MPLDIGGWVADTPGLKVFGLSDIDRNNLFQYFPEFSKFDGYCKFGDCLHLSEPGCAVKTAVESGEIHDFRYRSYKRIYDNLER